MAHKYLGDLLVLRTKVSGDVPNGQIELKVRKGRGKSFYLRMSLEEYGQRVVMRVTGILPESIGKRKTGDFRVP